MKSLLRLISLLLILSSALLSSCSSGAGSRSLVYAGAPSKDNTDKVLLVYSRRYDESSYNESAIYYLYYDAVVIDRKSGKVMDSVTIDLNKTELHFAGKTDNYVLFSGSGGYYALSTKGKLKFIDPAQFTAKVKAMNPQVKLYSLARNADDQLQLTANNGNKYLLRMSDLKGRPGADVPFGDSLYLLEDNIPAEKEIKPMSIAGTYTNDSTIIQLRKVEGSDNQYELLQLWDDPKTHYLGQSDFHDRKLTERVFLNAHDFGVSGNTIYLLYQESLSSSQYLACFNYKTDQLIWKKPVSSLYTRDPGEINFTFYWLKDRKSFVIGSGSDYPLSFVDAFTGKVTWKH